MGEYIIAPCILNLGSRYMVTTSNPGSFTPREEPLIPIGCKAGWDPSQFGCFCQVTLVIRRTDPWFPDCLVCSLVTILKAPLNINVRTKPLHKHYSWPNEKLLSSGQNYDRIQLHTYLSSVTRNCIPYPPPWHCITHIYAVSLQKIES